MIGRTTTLQIPLAGGVDTSTDPRLVPEGKLSIAQDCAFNRRGELSKRNGYSRLPLELLTGEGSLSSSFGIHAFDDQLISSDGEALFSYAASRGKWHRLGDCPPVFSNNMPVIMTGIQQRNHVSCSIDRTSWFAYETDGEVRVTVRDDASGGNLVMDRSIGAGSRPQLIVFNGDPVLLYARGDSDSLNDVIVCRIGLNRLLSGAEIDPDCTIGGLNGSRNFEAITVTSGILVSFSTGTATHTARLEAFLAGFTIVNVQVHDARSDRCLSMENLTSGASLITVDENGLHRFVRLDAQGASTLVVSLNLSLSSSTPLDDPNPVSGTLFNVVDGNQRFSTGCIVDTVRVAQSVGTSTIIVLHQANGVVYQTSLNPNTGTVEPSTVLNTFCRIVSKPFDVDGMKTVMLHVSGAFDLDDHVAVRLSDRLPLMRANVLRGGPRTSPTLPSFDGTQVALEQGTLFPTDDVSSIGSIQAFGGSSFRFSRNVQTSVKFRQNLHVPGSIMRSTDGSSVFETNFLQAPDVVEVNTFISGTNGLSGSLGRSKNGGSGTYLYAFTYRWVDSERQVHESAPSVAKVVTVDTDGSFSAFHVRPLNHTQRPAGSVQLIGYRSTERLGDTSLQIPLRQFTSVTQPVISTPASLGNVVVDLRSDVDIRSNKSLYTVANERGNDTVGNEAPPPSRHAVAALNRLFVISTDERNRISFSKSSVAGEPVAFSSEFAITVQDDDNEDITALAHQPDRLIIFKPTHVYALAGHGPTNQGEDDDFQDPFTVTSDVGCDQPETITTVARGDGGLSGTVFRSRQGIYLLDEGLSTRHIGEPVRAFDNLTVVRAVHVPTQDQVRFLTHEGTCLVLDHRLNQWCTFTNMSAVDAIVVDDQFYVQRPDSGVIVKETIGQYDDDGQQIRLKIITGWVPPMGLHAECYVDRIWLLGERRGQHRLKMSVGFNEDPNFSATYTELFDADQILQTPVFEEPGPFDPDQPTQRYTFGMQTGKRCNTFRVLIEDEQDAPFNEGMKLTALSVDIRSVMGGAGERLSPRQRGRR